MIIIYLLIIILISIYINLINSSKHNNYTNSVKYCPASSLIHTELTGIHSYPIDLFDYTNKSYKYSYYNCTSSELALLIHICASTTYVCPLDKIDIETSIKSMKWNYKHSLCKLNMSAKSFKQSTRIIISGGSVTKGGGTQGCNCWDVIERNCPKNVNNEYHNCRWAHFIQEYFNKFNLSRIYNFANGGRTSPYMAEILGSEMKLHDLGLFTSKDVILLDHSVNDGMGYCSINLQNELLIGLESLIRRIFHYSTPGSWPTIILLEQWPYTDKYVDITKRPDKLSKNSTLYKYDYSHVYKKIAHKYDILLWSYRDVIWSNNFEHKFTEDSLEYLRFIKDGSSYQHPPWYVHLLYSDLITSLFEKEFELCNEIINPHRRGKSSMNITLLPDPYSHNETLPCDDNIESLLDLSSNVYLSKYRNLKYNKIGSYSTNPLESWQIYEDRIDKSGWIDEIISNNNITSNLTFTFDNKNNQLTNYPHIIKITYFRTYLNAGRVDVYICNQFLTTLDTLWKDYENYHISTNEVYTYYYDPMVLYHNVLNNPCLNDFIGTLEFRHSYYYDDLQNVRGHQKIKISHVSICQAAAS